MSTNNINETTAKEFGKRLSDARKSRGLTQKELAEAIGISQSTMTKIETGGQEQSKHSIKIASELNINPMWLTEGVGEMDDVSDSVLDTFLIECCILIIEKTKEFDPSIRQITTMVESIYNEGKTTRSVNANILKAMLNVIKE